MKKIKTKKFLKTLSLVLLGLATIGGVTTLATRLVKNDKVTIHPTFEVGGLNALGKYEEDKSTLYTKEKFACEGLQATLDFDSQISYQIYYYDILDNFISSTDIITAGYSNDAPLNGAYARIEITPTNDEDKKISFNERYSYAKQLNLKVNKHAKSNINKKFVAYGGNVLQVVNNPKDSYFEYGKKFHDGQFVELSSFCCTTKTLLNVSDYNYIRLIPSKVGSDINYSVEFFEFTDLPAEGAEYNLRTRYEDTNYTLNISPDTRYLIIQIYSASENLKDVINKLPSAFEVSKDSFK